MHQRLLFGKSKAGVDYQSLDMQPAHLFFMIAAPEGGAQTHLDALAKLSGILMDEQVRARLLDATSPEKYSELLMLLMMKQQKKKKKEAQEQEAAEANSSVDSTEPYVLLSQLVQQVSHIPTWHEML